MLQNTLVLLVAGQQQDATLSPRPALQLGQLEVAVLARGIPCSDTPWDQPVRECWGVGGGRFFAVYKK